MMISELGCSFLPGSFSIPHLQFLLLPFPPPPSLTSPVCSLCAAVQGMDETVVNGAQIFYKTAFGIGSDSDRDRDSWLVGLCNSAPYLCCAVISCWLTEPLNKRFGRKGTVFICCISMCLSLSLPLFLLLIPNTHQSRPLACFWQAFTNS